MIQRLTHIGHIVKDMQQGIEFYARLLGARPNGSVMDMPGGKALMVPIGNNFVELIQPTDSVNRVGQVLQQRGEGLFHISLRVDDIAAEIGSLRQKGIVVGDPREITSLPHRPKIAFLDPASACGAIIELAEEPILKNR
jgi:methylmalonyl-CoA epimerase